MTDEELITRLREVWAHEITIRAADRIESLVKERDGLLRVVTDNHVALLRAEAAEAKLAKAVDALRSYVSKEKGVWNTADAVLAELEKTE